VINYAVGARRPTAFRRAPICSSHEMPSTPDPNHSAAVRGAIDAIWRIESGRLIAGLARITGDLSQAEDMAHEALLAALERWPATGIPPNPGGWLMTTAKNKAIDAARRERSYQRKLALVAEDPTGPASATADRDEIDDRMDDHIQDDLLRLIFTACHPALPLEARVALILRCLGGLSTEEIARAFLISDSTAAQRIVRAKKALVEKSITFAMPTSAEIEQRMAAVLEVIYLIFNEGYAATTGEDWMRPELCAEALRLARILAQVAPHEAEVLGLLALLELQASRLAARLGPDGSPVLLLDQDRRRWDRLHIRLGLQALATAERLATSQDPQASGRESALGPYTLQASIAACHARAIRPENTDWRRIATLYEMLSKVWPSPVVDLNRAVATGMAGDPAAGLQVLEAAAASPATRSYPQLPAVRAHLLSQLGRHAEAAEHYREAADLTRNAGERTTFLARADTELNTAQNSGSPKKGY
jgi:RNA polymerase sigma factor (sigma-70 family)